MAAARRQKIIGARRRTRLIAAVALLTAAALCVPVALACDHGSHSTAPEAADARIKCTEARRRRLFAADGSASTDADGSQHFETDGSAARRLQAPTAARRYRPVQKVGNTASMLWQDLCRRRWRCCYVAMPAAKLGAAHPAMFVMPSFSVLISAACLLHRQRHQPRSRRSMLQCHSSKCGGRMTAQRSRHRRSRHQHRRPQRCPR